MSNRKQHPSIQYRLSEINDEELRTRLEHKYIEVEVHKRTQVESLRAAQRAAAMATRAMADVQIAELDFVIEAGEAFDLVQTEPAWMVRRNKEGAIVLECLLTQSDIQNIQRAQVNHVREQAKELNKDEPDTNGMFGEE